MEDIHNTEQSSPEISSSNACTNSSSNACTNSSTADPECKSQTGQIVAVSTPDLRKGGSKKGAECKSPKKKRRPKKRRNCCCQSKGMKQNGEKRGAGGKLCSSAASFGGDCAAVCCCCPCALLHLSILVLVKLPVCFAKKALCCTKKKIVKEEEEEEKEEEDKKRDQWQCYTPPWSCEGSPMQIPKISKELSCSTLESQEIWSELYASGHMGFGGTLFDRSHEHQSPLPT